MKIQLEKNDVVIVVLPGGEEIKITSTEGQNARSAYIFAYDKDDRGRDLTIWDKTVNLQ